MTRKIPATYPPIPPAPDRVTAVAYALAVEYPRSRHGQLCPVWAQNAGIDTCNCWQLSSALSAARGAIKALDAFDRMVFEAGMDALDQMSTQKGGNSDPRG